MTLAQRAAKVFHALLGVLGAVVMLSLDEGFLLVSLLISLSLILLGLRRILFYFTMARHMVNGRSVLYFGVIMLDFGIFTLSTLQDRAMFIVLYLFSTNAFSGLMGLLRAREAKRLGSPVWRRSLAGGLVSLALAAAAVYVGVFRADMLELTLLYAAGMLYTAAGQMASAFRKTAIVNIP